MLLKSCKNCSFHRIHNIYIYIYTHIYVCTNIYIYIYIYMYICIDPSMIERCARTRCRFWASSRPTHEVRIRASRISWPRSLSRADLLYADWAQWVRSTLSKTMISGLVQTATSQVCSGSIRTGIRRVKTLHLFANRVRENWLWARLHMYIYIYM